MHLKHIQRCRICGNPNLTEVINLGEQYFQGSFIKEGVAKPSMRKTPNMVFRCDTSKMENACGLIQTKHTVPPSILYANYWYQSGITATMRNHLKSITEEALKIVDIKEPSKINVLDVASNDSTSLRFYPDRCNKYGIDPSDIASKQIDTDITIVNDLFPSDKFRKKVGKIKFDIITSIACFYDIHDPRDFVKEIKYFLTNKGIWIFEVAYWPTMLEKLAYDSLVNEHIETYHLAPIEFLLKEYGLKLFKAKKTSTNGGSIMCFVTKCDNDSFDSDENKKVLNKLRLAEFDARLDDGGTYKKFCENVWKHKKELVSLIDNIRKEGKTIHILGLSTKLNTILSFCDIGPDKIPYAAERSPEKHGATSISGIKMISEEESRAMKPDYYLIGPYHFKTELLEREKEIREMGTKFIFPLPKIEIL